MLKFSFFLSSCVNLFLGRTHIKLGEVDVWISKKLGILVYLCGAFYDGDGKNIELNLAIARMVMKFLIATFGCLIRPIFTPALYWDVFDDAVPADRELIMTTCLKHIEDCALVIVWPKKLSELFTMENIISLGKLPREEIYSHPLYTEGVLSKGQIEELWYAQSIGKKICLITDLMGAKVFFAIVAKLKKRYSKTSSSN